MDGPPIPILLVDDDRELCAMLQEYLAGEGFAVTAVGDGEQALERLRGDHWEGVVLDVMLPGRDGFEVLRDLRRFSEVPVLMLTARGEDTDTVVGLELGADDYLAKPFNPR
ncbi:MAG: response regulator, partial [Thiohalospira sp.]